MKMLSLFAAVMIGFVSTISFADPALPPAISCQPDASGNVPENVVLNSSPNPGGGYWVTAQTCFKNPLAKVWEGLRSDGAMLWGETRPRHEKDADNQSPTNPVYTFDRGYEAGPDPFSEKWVMRYEHNLVQGTLAQPQQVLMKFEKTQGTSHIRTWRGQVQMNAVNPNSTVLTMEAVVDADRTKQSDAEAVATELIDRVREQL
jgi:hypothetical protein